MSDREIARRLAQALDRLIFAVMSRDEFSREIEEANNALHDWTSLEVDRARIAMMTREAP